VNLPDLIRTGGQHVVFDYRDFSGFGTGAPTDGRQAFGAAGVIASQGRQTYDLSTFLKLTVTGQGAVPITMDVSAAQGDPDLLGVFPETTQSRR
jgi:hypothetical protein